MSIWEKFQRFLSPVSVLREREAPIEQFQTTMKSIKDEYVSKVATIRNCSEEEVAKAVEESVRNHRIGSVWQAGF